MTSARKSNEPPPIANTLRLLGVFMAAPRTVITALMFDVCSCTPPWRPHPRHSVAVRSLTPGLLSPYPFLALPYADRWTSCPTSVPAELCLLSGQRGLRAWRALLNPPTVQRSEE